MTAIRRIITPMRRWLLLWTLAFWQGGFMFYGAVVVPAGSALLGSEREQGFITRSVTIDLNLAGAVALAVWCWDLSAGRSMSRGGHRLRWTIWSVVALSLALLAWLHSRLDRILDPDGLLVIDPPRFRRMHRAYLLVSTVQWAGCGLLSALTIRAWRHDDATADARRRPPDREPVLGDGANCGING